ncbi:dipeptide epimerase [Ureibacillus sp. FSL K6-8385]|uniref:Dipeptide epimerase n=1 Tax=Ureibacillus terrenus TaxID=118246 RepID=A0A540V598_9BACL|nr:dipeptide epimerase [Ureibacillus terrenus]MED3661114.1 dipeptide epimerase [Ureibacillus terrenus]MED3764408.1 dipeptide epimerase [Ureibacillus terrenus]TQE91921.1 dipeptide epimerase [Ureibacillus terrenus]
MNIQKIEIFSVDFPLVKPFIVSYGTFPVMPSIIVKLTTSEGFIGWGESVPDEHVTGETIESTFHVLKHSLAPAMLNENPFHIEKIHDKMDRIVKGVPSAKAAIDIACFDVTGKKLGVPVYQLIGGRFHKKFPVTHVLSIDEPEKMAEEADQKVKEGYRSFKMKVGTDVESDVERIKAVRQRVGEHVAIRIDVNQGWVNSSNTLRAVRKLESLGIDWLEQPVRAEDIDAMAEVKSKSAIPIMIDEGLCSVRDMREVIAKKAADKANIKLMKCGGIYPAVKLIAMAEMGGIECQIGSMVESSIASAAGFHVAFSKKNVKSVELTGPLKFKTDIGDLKKSYNIPFIELNEKAGLGVEVNEAVLSELTVDSCVIE